MRISKAVGRFVVSLMNTPNIVNSVPFRHLCVVGLAVVGTQAIWCGRATCQEPVRDRSRVAQTAFAPGVMQVIPPAVDAEETFDGPTTLKPLLSAHPELEWKSENHPDGQPYFDPRSRTVVEMAKQVILRREIYCLEFAFKPLRHIYLDIPRPDGRMQRKLIWYMVYRVRYRGGDLRPAKTTVADADVFGRIEAVSYPSRRFFPLLVMKDHATDSESLDTILPTAKRRIAIREQITAPLYNSVQISSQRIPRTSDKDAPGIWGVATWADIDPGADFLTVNVYGLTNAFEQDGLEADAPYRRKCLSLNFYRPGDATAQTEDQIRFGVPAFESDREQKYILDQFGLDERLDYRWIFR